MTADQLQQTLMLLAACLLIAVALAVLGPRPRWALTAFLLTICFAPIWFGGNLTSFVTPHIAMGVLCLLSLAFTHEHAQSVPRAALRTKAQPFDAVLILLFALAAGSYVLHVVSFGQVFLIGVWTLMYVVGRLAGLKIGLTTTASILAVAFGVVALLALVEFASGRNLWLEFTGNGTPSFAAWGVLQYRGGYVRAEGAFGHSIALGGSLAIAMILTFASRFRTGVKLALAGLMASALVVTFSRIGMITAGVGLVLLIARSKSITHRLRLGLAGLTAVAAPIVLFLASDAFSDDSGGNTDSALYRLWLWGLIPSLKPVGQSRLVFQTTDGTSTVGSFGSIDSAVILHAVSNGWVPTLVLCLCFSIAALRLLVRGGDEALITLVALIPAFFTVALITQYAHFVWFVVGLAVSGLRTAGTPDPSTATASLGASTLPKQLAGVK